jgi:hypothetical protein
LDLSAIYQCLREGYEKHPSAPENLTVTDVSETSATLEWTEPLANAHRVVSYTLVIRKDEHGAPITEACSNVQPTVT